MSNCTAIWQDIECPFTHTKQIVRNGEILHYAEQYACRGCGSLHFAGVRVHVTTFFMGDGRLEVRGIPIDEKQKDEWLERCGT